MTKKLEDFFNLSPTSDNTDDEEIVVPTKTREELMSEATEICSALSTAEKVDYALPVVVGLDTHDNEMDFIANKAIKTFDDLVALGGNVADLHAGKMYEVAGQLLKTALEARNAKADKKLKMIELQLKKVRAEQIDLEQGNAGGRIANGGEFDRNELLKYIVSSKSENSDK